MVAIPGPKKLKVAAGVVFWVDELRFTNPLQGISVELAAIIGLRLISFTTILYKLSHSMGFEEGT